jgi:hypothetical protein
MNSIADGTIGDARNANVADEPPGAGDGDVEGGELSRHPIAIAIATISTPRFPLFPRVIR